VVLRLVVCLIGGWPKPGRGGPDPALRRRPKRRWAFDEAPVNVIKRPTWRPGPREA